MSDTVFHSAVRPSLRKLATIIVAAAFVASCSVAVPGAIPGRSQPMQTLAPMASRVTDTGEGSPEVLDLSAWPPDEFWLQVSPGGLAVYVYPSLAYMTQNVDLVVVGRIKEVLDGRPIPADAGAEGFGLGTITFSVEEVLRGDPVETKPGLLQIEFLMGDARLLPRYTSRIPPERVILFLMNKGLDAERNKQDPKGPLAGYDVYAIQGPQGYLRVLDERIDSPIGVEDAWLADLDGRTYQDVRALIAAAANPS